MIITNIYFQSTELNNLSTECSKCKSDANQSGTIHIQNLCPVDKKRICELMERLAEYLSFCNSFIIDNKLYLWFDLNYCSSTRARQSAEKTIFILKAELNTWKNCYAEFDKKTEIEKSQLQLQVNFMSDYYLFQEINLSQVLFFRKKNFYSCVLSYYFHWFELFIK